MERMRTRFDHPVRPHADRPLPAGAVSGTLPESGAAVRQSVNGVSIPHDNCAPHGCAAVHENPASFGRTMVHENAPATGRHLAAVAHAPVRERRGAPRSAPGRAAGSAGEGGATRLPDGERVWLREAGPADREAALRLHARCSAETLRLRYHGPVEDAGRYLAHLLDPRHGTSLAVASACGELIALGHLLWDGEESEIALLVADDWQRRGVGTLLLRRLVVAARARRRSSVYAVTAAANTGMRAALRGLNVPLGRHEADGVVVLSATVPGPANSGNSEEERVPAYRK